MDGMFYADLIVNFNTGVEEPPYIIMDKGVSAASSSSSSSFTSSFTSSASSTSDSKSTSSNSSSCTSACREDHFKLPERMVLGRHRGHGRVGHHRRQVTETGDSQ